MSELNVYLFRYTLFLAYVLIFIGCAASIYATCTELNGFRRILCTAAVIAMLSFASFNFYFNFLR